MCIRIGDYLVIDWHWWFFSEGRFQANYLYQFFLVSWTYSSIYFSWLAHWDANSLLQLFFFKTAVSGTLLHFFNLIQFNLIYSFILLILQTHNGMYFFKLIYSHGQLNKIKLSINSLLLTHFFFSRTDYTKLFVYSAFFKFPKLRTAYKSSCLIYWNVQLSTSDMLLLYFFRKDTVERTVLFLYS